MAEKDQHQAMTWEDPVLSGLHVTQPQVAHFLFLQGSYFPFALSY